MSNSYIPQQVGQSFGRAAARYDYNAVVQQQIVDHLIRRIRHIALPFEPRILEIGAGTGTLTRKMQAIWPHAHFVVSDISLPMLQTARSQIDKKSKTDFVVMGAGNLAIQGHFDLIVSSMVLHWLPDPLQSIRKISELLSPGGIFSFTMMAENSFVYWRQACNQAGVPCGLWDYLTLEQVKSVEGVFALQEKIKTFFDSASDFLNNLKSIGSGMPKPGYKPLTPAQMRAALRLGNEMKPFMVNYEVIFGAYHATSGIADLPNPS